VPGFSEGKSGLSLSASAFAQGAVVSPTSVFSKTLLLYVANCSFYDEELASKYLFSDKKWSNWAYNPLILRLIRRGAAV
jgi:hypothetical protein